MCIKNIKCRGYIYIDCIIYHLEGCIKDKSWLKSINIPCFLNKKSKSNFYIDTEHCKLILIETVSQGAFGFIDSAKLINGNIERDVYVKRPILTGDSSLLLEALFQKVVENIFIEMLIPTGTPTVLTIFKLKDNSICFAMEQIDKAETIDRFLDKIPSTEYTRFMIECIIQISSIVFILNDIIGINHRDLKPSNFLIRKSINNNKFITVPDTLSVSNLPKYEQITVNYSFILIDFGFACIGDILTQKTDVSLSTVYSVNDPCPKEGRDMFLFLGHLYLQYHSRFSNDLKNIFEKWLSFTPGLYKLLLFNDIKHSSNWLYFISGCENILNFRDCSPNKIFNDLLPYFKN